MKGQHGEAATKASSVERRKTGTVGCLGTRKGVGAAHETAEARRTQRKEILRGLAARGCRAAAVALSILALLMGLGLTGCVSKARAKAEVRAAYLAGQQAQFQGPSVRINGPVKNPVLPWTPGLTLMKAIVSAEYEGATDPAEIIVVHGGMATRVEVRQLLAGEDVPLQPGDIVQIQSLPTPARPRR